MASKKKLTRKEREELIELRKQGLPITEIAKRFGVSRQAISQWLRYQSKRQEKKERQLEPQEAIPQEVSVKEETIEPQVSEAEPEEVIQRLPDRRILLSLLPDFKDWKPEEATRFLAELNKLLSSIND